MNTHRDPQPKSTAQPSLAELRIVLPIEQITVTGIELTELESQRFTALLTEELKLRLIEQFAVSDADINAEALRFGMSEIALNIDQPNDLDQAVREVARRLAQTLESAVKKGESNA